MIRSPETPLPQDLSNGYEEVAEAFMAARSSSGRAVVAGWAASLPRGASVIDLGAGSGEPMTAALIEAGLTVSAIDAAPSLVKAFQRRFPGVEIACEAAEESAFFGRTFEAALAVGLVFLLSEARQRALMENVASALNAGGRFLFSAPHQVCAWDDVLTGQRSRSLGTEAYADILAACGLHIVATHEDEGGTHYFEAEKSAD
ncbi:MAG: class I SAM-dependent methyltransferase [Henriciella sp.]|nr:class I SAM-dependent methyltransferase [Henriciella sp.]